MKQYRDKYPIEKMAKALNLSRSGYYKHLQKDQGKRYQETMQLKMEVRKVFHKHKERYGSPRIQQELFRSGLVVSRNRVAKLMREMGLKARSKRKYKYPKEKAETPAVPNILEQKFMIDHPYRVFASDITYLYYRGGKAYLTVILDLFNREPVGWELSRRLLADKTVLPSLNEMIHKINLKPGAIFHSDKGSQYRAICVIETLNAHHFVRSMSGKGNCFDNAVIESFFSTLKSECSEYQNATSFDQLYSIIFEYLEGYYINHRLHSILGNKTPREYSNEYFK